MLLENRHRGFAFVTFTSQQDAQDAIDNMDMNELEGRVLKVSSARPQKATVQGAGNRAGLFSGFISPLSGLAYPKTCPLLVWESEEWLKQHIKPLSESGGVKGKIAGSQPGVMDGEEALNEEQMEG
jgi:peptidyl-prolyl isomerase E (cyclophilin E)